MYQTPKLERFGNFRELTHATLGMTGGDNVSQYCGDNTVGPPDNPNYPGRS